MRKLTIDDLYISESDKEYFVVSLKGQTRKEGHEFDYENDNHESAKAEMVRYYNNLKERDLPDPEKPAYERLLRYLSQKK